MKAYFQKYSLEFQQPILTSRGAMKFKNGYYLFFETRNRTAVGECSFIENLSIDSFYDYEQMLQSVCDEFMQTGTVQLEKLKEHPSIAFGVETALLDLKAEEPKILFPSAFTSGLENIPINGLIWMGEKEKMLSQIKLKMQDGFRCIKIKVAAIDFDEECSLIEFIRSHFDKSEMEIRLDANGGFTVSDVEEKLTKLAAFDIHSIEQPLKPKQTKKLKELCKKSIIPIALDEELIGLQIDEIEFLLQEVKPAYVILKPSLLGGLERCNQIIELADREKIGWWATSALESNIGLNAIAQWVFTKKSKMIQGLGTGTLYKSNWESPLLIQDGMLKYQNHALWQHHF